MAALGPKKQLPGAARDHESGNERMSKRSQHPTPDPVGPGQESVWDYPRPPALRLAQRHVRVELGGQVVAETDGAYQVLETSHPPAYYLPPDSCVAELFEPAAGRSFCEWKGVASYWTVRAGDRVAERAAWSYANPTDRFAGLADHVSFYPSVFACYVDDAPVVPQAGQFYGGWITPDVVGPFKGPPGSEWW